MDRTERFVKINQLLQSRKSTSIDMLTETLSVSRATIKRDICYMRDRLYAPIVWDRNRRGYRFEDADPDFPQYTLPGIWFNSSEAYALLTMEFMLRRIQPGLLGPHIHLLRNKIRGILEHSGEHSMKELKRRIRIIHRGAPILDSNKFRTVSAAVLGRLQLHVHYLNRRTQEITPRVLSPQRLVYYNEVWYLDTWCHLRNSLRTFRLDNLSNIELTTKTAKEIEDSCLDSVLASGFGIFSGEKTELAVLRFSNSISSLIARENWHLDQQMDYDEQGRLIMTLPYSADSELVRQILKYGPELEVLKPTKLRNKIKSMISAANQIYAG